MTAFEVMVIITCVLILAALLLPMLANSKRRTNRIGCAANLRQINLAFRIWEGDNGNQYPMAVSVTNGGAMELIDAGDVAGCLRIGMSNEMNTAKILVCPNDSGRTFTTKWDDLNNSHISYFLSADAKEDYPQMVLDGDDNLATNGVRARSGLLNVSSNSPVSWFGSRHGGCGYLGLADGSVDLRQGFQGAGLPTNRIVVP